MGVKHQLILECCFKVAGEFYAKISTVAFTPFIIRAQATTFHDKECEVTGYKQGKGKYEVLVDSLKCKLDNGVEFKTRK